MSWPAVLDEEATLNKVLAGASIARFGDGEFNLCLGKGCITQPHNRAIEERLKLILTDGGLCLVGIPRMKVGPKERFWAHYNTVLLWNMLGRQTYGSAFITRPDSAPWINTDEYWEKVERLWRDKEVTLVRGPAKSLVASMLNSAADVHEVIVPGLNAWQDYHSILERARQSEIVLLCAGPTATVMAHDLCHLGHQAIDLGHIGMFLRKHRNNEPMTVTEQDKAWDRTGHEVAARHS